MGLIIFAVLTAISGYGLWQLFVKAGRNGWEAIVPFYSQYIQAKLTGRPTWWVILLLVPIVNIFVFYNLYLDFIHCFGKRRFWENAAAVLVPFIVLPMWAKDNNVRFLNGLYAKNLKAASQEGVELTEEKRAEIALESYKDYKIKYPYKKSMVREWADAIVFATVAASLIRGFLIEAYMIPTGSMERTLLIGDFLFVSKLNYGPRVPNTPIAFPFAHHTMPITGGKAYSELIELPYKRLPGFQKIERNDVVVFNFPAGDTVALENQNASYYDLVRAYGWQTVNSQFTIQARPIDKRENYIKRCVGLPGDKIFMKDAKLFVNDQPGFDPPESQLDYLVLTDGTPLNMDRLRELRIEAVVGDQQPGVYQLFMTKDELAIVKSWSNVKEIRRSPVGEGCYPYDPQYKWDFDNFGPILIPKKGWTVALNTQTLPIYERAIRVYENNKLEKRSDGIYINDVKADHYTFKMDYFWMMGDNRHNSLDSRGWGFVPEDHVVGKALFTWMSWDEIGTGLSKIRWNRIFKGIH
ncbi:MAG: signal peptidase I [Sphingobacterium sp.]|jgi:signal peptidase I|uniref:signal peptidase I n=1 Tax=Sphingobacterium sp. TaxID=341027 RepID=UPI0028471996|nr:signal peptidase I [Sphingobacterium sp.]MDR3009931.1 signal peptidase I [Sphingobacterium sp.]